MRQRAADPKAFATERDERVAAQCGAQGIDALGGNLEMLASLAASIPDNLCHTE